MSRRLRIARWCGAVLCFMAAAIGYGAYSEYFRFEPGIANLLSSMPTSEREPSPQFVQAFKRVHPDGLDGVIVFRLRSLVAPEQESQTMTSSRDALWKLLFRARHTRSEALAIYAHTLSFESGNGLDAASRFYFDKSPDQLTYRECLSIIVMARNPGALSMRRNPERFAAAMERYL